VTALRALIEAVVLLAFFTLLLTLANAGAAAMFPGSL
jgi:hypothetical protein